MPDRTTHSRIRGCTKLPECFTKASGVRSQKHIKNRAETDLKKHIPLFQAAQSFTYFFVDVHPRFSRISTDYGWVRLRSVTNHVEKSSNSLIPLILQATSFHHHCDYIFLLIRLGRTIRDVPLEGSLWHQDAGSPTVMRLLCSFHSHKVDLDSKGRAQKPALLLQAGAKLKEFRDLRKFNSIHSILG